MIYLFNSASRSLYTTNILNTLHLPNGCTNEYRYRYGGERININPSDVDSFINDSEGKDVLIVYIDRFSNDGYKYYPLRKGKINTVREHDNRLFFNVQLFEYLHSTDIQAFNTEIKENLASFNLPSLSNDDPSNPDDGYYAIEHADFLTQNNFETGDSFWTQIVERIKETKSFNSDEYDFVFSKCSYIKNKKNRKPISTKKSDQTYSFEVYRDSKYEMRFSYIFPDQENNNYSRAKLVANFDENIRVLGKKEFNIDSYSNSFLINFKSKKHIEENLGSLSFSFEHMKPNKKLLGTASKIPFKIKEPKSFWAQIFLALIIYSACGIIIGTDNFEKFNIGFLSFLNSLTWKGIAGFGQALVMFWLFRLFGRRIM